MAKTMFGKERSPLKGKAISLDSSLLYVADGNNFLHRAKHAMKDKPVMWNDFNTSYMRGFLNILGAELLQFQPTHLAVVFDGDGEGFRKELWPTYKANRESHQNAAAGIVDNISITMRESMNNLRDFLAHLGIKCLQLRDVEGDDVIKSVVTLTNELPTIVSSNDKDILQLLKRRVSLVSTHWGLVTPDVLASKWGLKPKQVVDYLAMMGDSIDNYHGVRGVGPKYAVAILKEFGDVATFLAMVKKDHPLFKFKAKIEDSDFKIFRQLAKLVAYDLEDPEEEGRILTIDDFKLGEPDKEAITEWLESFGIRKYSPYISKVLGLTEGRVKRLF